MADFCPVMRRKLVKHGTISMIPVGAGEHVGPDGFKETSREVVIEPCNSPLFGSAREAERCRSCEAGWSMPGNELLSPATAVYGGKCGYCGRDFGAEQPNGPCPAADDCPSHFEEIGITHPDN